MTTIDTEAMRAHYKHNDEDHADIFAALDEIDDVRAILDAVRADYPTAIDPTIDGNLVAAARERITRALGGEPAERDAWQMRAEEAEELLGAARKERDEARAVAQREKLRGDAAVGAVGEMHGDLQGTTARADEAVSREEAAQEAADSLEVEARRLRSVVEAIRVERDEARAEIARLTDADRALREAHMRTVDENARLRAALDPVAPFLIGFAEHLAKDLDPALFNVKLLTDLRQKIDAALASTAPPTFTHALKEAQAGPLGQALRAIPDAEFAAAIDDSQSPRGDE